jgi:GDPmannose 4,6-dehydratase
VREFTEKAFACAGRSIAWSGQGVAEVGRDTRTGEVVVAVDPAYFRPTEVDLLLGDPSKAHQRLGWRYTTRFEDLVAEMVEADLKRVQHEQTRRNRND